MEFTFTAQLIVLKNIWTILTSRLEIESEKSN